MGRFFWAGVEKAEKKRSEKQNSAILLALYNKRAFAPSRFFLSQAGRVGGTPAAPLLESRSRPHSRYSRRRSCHSSTMSRWGLPPTPPLRGAGWEPRTRRRTRCSGSSRGTRSPHCGTARAESAALCSAPFARPPLLGPLCSAPRAACAGRRSPIVTIVSLPAHRNRLRRTSGCDGRFVFFWFSFFVRARFFSFRSRVLVRAARPRPRLKKKRKKGTPSF